MMELIFYDRTGNCELVQTEDDDSETVRWRAFDDEDFMSELGATAHLTEADFDLVTDYLIDTGIIDEDEAAELADHTYAEDDEPEELDESDDDTHGGNVYDAA